MVHNSPTVTASASVYLDRFKAKTLFDAPQEERDEDVETLADALEHDEVEWNSDESVEHAEDLSARRLRRTVAVACKTDDGNLHVITQPTSRSLLYVDYCNAFERWHNIIDYIYDY